MAFQRVPGTWQAQMKGVTPGGKLWVCNLYFKPSTYDQPNQGGADALMLLIHDAYIDNNADDQLSTGWQFGTLVVTGLDASTDAQVTSTAHPVTGTDSTNPLPDQSSLLINLTTDLRGRSYQGRIFHPGFTEGKSSGNQPVASVFTAFNLWAEQIRNDAAVGNFPQQVVSRFSGMELRGGPHGQILRRPVARDEAITTEVNGRKIDNNWKTQRRRELAG